MAVTVLYRIRTGEVLKISSQGQTFADRAAAVFGVLADPTFLDGTDTRRTLAGGVLGPAREAGWSKIVVVATNTVRNATQVEIDGFAAGEQADTDAQDAARVAVVIQSHPHWRRALKPLVRKLHAGYAASAAKTNAHLQQWADYKAAVAAPGSTLATIKAATAAMPAIAPNLPTPTFDQVWADIFGDVRSTD